MNERYKELVKQADEYADDLGLGGSEWCDVQLRKFAELIVKECAKVVNDTEYPYENESDKNAWDICCVWSAAKLKEHFGVEE